MDKIHLNHMAFYGHHGVLPEETRLGQRFYLDVELSLDLSDAGRSDCVDDTVSYGEVFEKVREVVEGHRFHLLEALAENVAATLLKEFPPVQEVRVLVKKPEAPLKGILNFVGVEIVRTR